MSQPGSEKQAQAAGDRQKTMGIKVKTVENESRNEKSEPVRYTSRKSKAKSFGMKARTLDSLNVGHDDDKETAQLRRDSETETERLIQAQAQRL